MKWEIDRFGIQSYQIPTTVGTQLSIAQGFASNRERWPNPSLGCRSSCLGHFPLVLNGSRHAKALIRTRIGSRGTEKPYWACRWRSRLRTDTPSLRCT